MTNRRKGKRYLLSRTIRTNAGTIVACLGVVAAKPELLGPYGAYVVMAIAIANIILRAITTEPLTK